MSRLLSLVLASLLVIGCSSSGKKEDLMKPAKLVKFKASAKMSGEWSRLAGTGQDKRYSRFVPALSDDRIFVCDVEGKVFAFDALTGNKVWKVDLDVEVSAGLFYDRGRLLLGTYDAGVIALNAENGSLLWKGKASSEVSALPVSNGLVVVAQSIDGQVFGMDAETGEKKWSFDHPVPVLTLRGAATPVFYSDLVILPFESGQLVALKANEGSSVWEARVGQPKGVTELERIVDVDSSPLVIGDSLYAATFQGSLAAFSPAQGQPIWKQSVSTYQDLVYSQGKVYVSAEDSTVFAFDSTTGEKVWENNQLFRRDLTAPTVVGDYIAVIDFEGFLHLLNQDDGSFAYRFKPVGDKYRSPLISKNNMLYILADEGRLTAYELKQPKTKKTN